MVGLLWDELHELVSIGQYKSHTFYLSAPLVWALLLLSHAGASCHGTLCYTHYKPHAVKSCHISATVWHEDLAGKLRSLLPGTLFGVENSEQDENIDVDDIPEDVIVKKRMQ